MCKISPEVKPVNTASENEPAPPSSSHLISVPVNAPQVPDHTEIIVSSKAEPAEAW